jgi:arginyl-tRNA synthetase
MQKNNVAADSIESSMLGHMYVLGAKAYKENPESKKEIDEINKKVYRKDPTIKNLYNSGRKVSLDHFEEIYKVLGTTFTYYFFESEVAQQGVDIVKEFLQKGVFEKSEGAIVFQGENHGLHTRVFLTSQELPTYESKDLGLNKIKFEKEPDLFESIIITGNEQSEYFKVVLKAMSFIMSEVAAKTRHIAHGMMSGIGGKKMSSRTGDVVTGESLLKDVREMASEKIKNSDRDIDDPQELADQIAVGAIKYMILKQAPGNNISFDPEQALSFEGDSGPYLQYTYARTQSVLEKAKSEDVPSRPEAGPPSAENVADIKRLLYRFPEIVEDALENFAPHHVAGYLIDVARDFNSFYGDTKIVDREDTESPSRVALTKAVSIVLKNGLYLLGIEAPEKM